MNTERHINFFKSPSRLAAIAAIGCALALPAAASADPGSAGAHSAQSNYQTPNGPTVLGEQPAPNQPTEPGTSNSPGTDNSAPTVAPAVPAASKPSGHGGVSSIPFTGLSALLVAAVALLLIGGGMAMRRAARATAAE
jgi:hypothetical protein